MTGWDVGGGGGCVLERSVGSAGWGSVGGSCDLVRFINGFVLDEGVGGRGGSVDGFGGTAGAFVMTSGISREVRRDCAGESVTVDVAMSGGDAFCTGGEDASSG